MLDMRIYTFLDLCRTENFTKTAVNMHISQPAVSQQLKLLEEYYGVKLFIYQNRRFALTPEGEFLRDRMTDISREEEQVRSRLQKMFAHNERRIEIGAVPPIGNYSLTKLIAEYSEINPDARFSLTIDNADVLVGLLKSGILDCIIVDDFMKDDNLERSFFTSQKVCCVCAPSHHLAGTTIKFNELLSETIYSQGSRSYGNYCLEQILLDNGHSLNEFELNNEISTYISLINLLKRGNGIAFAYEDSILDALDSRKLSEINIEDFNSSVNFSAATLNHIQMSESTSQFLEYCKTSDSAGLL